MVQQALNVLAGDVEGCETLAYADLSTSLVLASNSQSRLSRDGLNDLCAEAALLLEGGHLAIVGTGQGFRLFLRDREVATDCLIGVCGPGTDMAHFLPAARECLAGLAASGDEG